MARPKTPPAPLQEWAQRTPARFVDRDAWPIHRTARVSCRRNGKRVSGDVLDTFTDHKQRPVVEVTTAYGTRLFRPEECRVQRGKKDDSPGCM